MNLLNNLIPYILTLTIAALIPGPGMLGLLFKTLRRNYRNALLMLFGLVTGDLIYLAIALSGLNFLGKQINHELNFILISLACSYLFFMAWKLWQLNHIDIGPSDSLNENLHSSSIKTICADYFSGLLLTLSNPKTITFYLALVPSIFGTQFILDFSFLSLVIFSTILTLCIVGSLYIFSALKIKKLLEHPMQQSILIKMIAITMTCVGLWLLWSQVISILYS